MTRQRIFCTNRIMLFISCFFLLISCNSKKNTILAENQWTKLEESSDSIRYRYYTTDKFVTNYFKDSACYHEGWITCPYIQEANVTFYRKENLVIVSDIVFKSAFTLPNEIETTWSKKKGNVVFEFGIPFLSYPPENLFPW